MPTLSLSDLQTYSNVVHQGATVTTTSGADGTYSVTTVDAAGNIESGDFNANQVLTHFAWNNVDGGGRGSANFRADGGFLSAYIWTADGEVIQVAEDGSYDVTKESDNGSLTRYYDAAGKLTGDAWSNDDGSSGRTFYGDDGSVQAAYIRQADGSLKQVNADGSYDITSTEANGTVSTYYVSADGTVTGRSYTAADGTIGRSFENGDGTRDTYETAPDGTWTYLVSDWYGNNTIEHYDANNRLVKTGYTTEDGHRGGATYETDGSFVSYDFKPDGSYLYKVGDANGHVTEQWYTADNEPFDPNATAVAGNAQADALVAALATFGAGAGAAAASSGAAVGESELLLAASAS